MNFLEKIGAFVIGLFIIKIQIYMLWDFFTFLPLGLMRPAELIYDAVAFIYLFFFIKGKE